MDKKNRLIILLVILTVLILVAAGLWYYLPSWNPNPAPSNEPEFTLVNSVSYLCKDGKTIEAGYYKGKPVTVNPGERPVNNGRVALKLSDGRNLILSQTISGSGIRYANKDESFVFWGKGNGALVLEDNVEKSFIGCVILLPDQSGLPNAYSNGTGEFSIRYPIDYTVNAAYKYQGLGPGKDIDGVKFTIPASLASGTNLSKYDTGVSVEEIPQITDCTASIFLDGGSQAQPVTDDGTDYSVSTSSQGAAGNFYEEQVWAIPGTNPCFALRYFIHSTNIQNYPAGTVKAFDRNALLTKFDNIRRSLTLAP